MRPSFSTTVNNVNPTTYESHNLNNMKKANIPVSAFVSASFPSAMDFACPLARVSAVLLFDLDVEAFFMSSDRAVDATLPFKAAFAFLGGAISTCLPLDVAFLTYFDTVNHLE
jgi:hypothetical protein